MRNVNRRCMAWVLFGLIISLCPIRAAGLTNANNQLWNQNLGLIPGTAASGDGFGSAVAAGDFNGDGFMDLAIGIPYKKIGTNDNAGALVVLYGSLNRLTSSGSQLFTQEHLPNTYPEPDDLFGYTLAVGNFNGDAYDDLAVASPTEAIGRTNGAGCVHVMYGTPSGLSGVGAQYLAQTHSGLLAPHAYDRFGFSLAAGDFNGDGYDELAVGVPWETVAGQGSCGIVQIYNGRANKLDLAFANITVLHQGLSGLGMNEPGDSFGYSLASGNFNGDGFDDLAIGIPFEDLSGVTSCGEVLVLGGSIVGLVTTGPRWFSLGSSGIGGTKAANDRYGYSLTTGNFNGDTYDDLVVGIPHKDGSVADCGFVSVVYGAASGLSGANSQLFSQDTTGIVGVEEAGDFFGWAVAAGDFNADGYDDLVAGVPLEDLTTPNIVTNAGMINVIYGSASRLTSTGNQLWHQDSPLIVGVAGNNERFGNALAVGDFNGDGADDLAIGVPNDLSGASSIGGVNVIYGRPAAQTRWHDGAAALGGGWYRMAWFGDFIKMPNDWIWHQHHGYMYCASTTPAAMWLWTMDMAWLWTGQGVYTYMYRLNDDAWLWYQRPSVGPRWFLNLNTSAWESH